VESSAFEEMNCPIARTLDVIGDRWTPLVVRDVALGISRFDDIQRNLGISRKVLSQRLAALARDGIVERVAYQEHPPRHDYRLTEQGVDLTRVLLAMAAFGNRWFFADGPAMEWEHVGCGGTARSQVACSRCGEELEPAMTVPVLRAGYAAGPGTSEIPAAVQRWRALVA
jgi:DNA-binding HxlR family transcriptional regulator